MKQWYLTAEYPAGLYFSKGLDSAIEQVVGQERDGSGMGAGWRDLCFTVAGSRQKLVKMAARVRRVHSKIKVSFAAADNG